MEIVELLLVFATVWTVVREEGGGGGDSLGDDGDFHSISGNVGLPMVAVLVVKRDGGGVGVGNAASGWLWLWVVVVMVVVMETMVVMVLVVALAAIVGVVLVVLSVSCVAGIRTKGAATATTTVGCCKTIVAVVCWYTYTHTRAISVVNVFGDFNARVESNLWRKYDPVACSYRRGYYYLRGDSGIGMLGSSFTLGACHELLVTTDDDDYDSPDAVISAPGWTSLIFWEARISAGPHR